MISKYILEHIHDFSISDLERIAKHYSLSYTLEELAVIYQFLQKNQQNLFDLYQTLSKK